MSNYFLILGSCDHVQVIRDTVLSQTGWKLAAIHARRPRATVARVGRVTDSRRVLNKILLTQFLSALYSIICSQNSVSKLSEVSQASQKSAKISAQVLCFQQKSSLATKLLPQHATCQSLSATKRKT